MTALRHASATINGSKMPTVELEYVTPDTAEQWLQANSDNRAVRRAHVARLAREISEGDFLVTGEGVKFDWDGVLIDGQHRLHACIEANEPIWTFVFRNLNPAVRIVIDTGKKRSGADALNYSTTTTVNRNLLAATGRIGVSWDNGVYRRSNGNQEREVTNTELVEWVSAHPEIEASIALADQLRRSIQIPPSPMAFCHYLFSRINSAEADQFFDDLLNLRTTGKGDPLFTLVRRYESVRASRELVRNAGHLSMIIRAWNARRDHEPLFVLKVGSAGKNGVIGVPQPK